MILADENIDHSIMACLRNEGIDVYSIYETQRGTTDLDIVTLSRNPPRIILTEDKDFADIVFAYQTKGISVILLRYAFGETEQITQTLIHFLKNHMESVWGKFVTITTSKIRMRVIE